ncbi:MAG TPA: molybdopterin-dependent oxidoreductase [Candidatus Eisenbacteria bacterium]|nr:molybdopterin-dependent oxidoreductase [Candidatus Eisenbacteria bacterium]
MSESDQPRWVPPLKRPTPAPEPEAEPEPEKPKPQPEPEKPEPQPAPEIPEPNPQPEAPEPRPQPEAPEPRPGPEAPEPAPPPAPRAQHPSFFTERPEPVFEIPADRLRAHSRRDFVLFTLGALASASTAWWLLPDRTKARLLPGPWRDRLDTAAARVGLSGARRERALNQALSFDDDVAEALYSKDRRVRTYARSETTPLRNNYNGATPASDYLLSWRLELLGLASKEKLALAIEDLLGRFRLADQVTRLVCVEGWSTVAWWKGIRFADLVQAFPPAPGARWAALRSAVNLDGAGRPDPYYVSIDLDTARHPQTLLATHLAGAPLTVEHGAPLRLAAPMKLGLKNIKAITQIEYTSYEPPDYWHERGYSKYDGL